MVLKHHWLRDKVLLTGGLILLGGEAIGLVKLHEVEMGTWGIRKQIKKAYLRIQDITSGKGFRGYLVQLLQFATKETEIEQTHLL